MTEQVENVLDLSQSEAGLLPTQKEEIDLLAFMTKLVRERENTIIGAGMGLDLKGRRGRVVDADPRQMERALGHLLDNAIAWTPRGGLIEIYLPKPSEGDPWRGRIIIADNGSGMTPEELARAEGTLGTGAEEAAGGGLGIRLARQLVEAHDGTLELESEKGVGTQAIVTLP